MAHMEGTINLEMMFLKNGYRLGDKLGKGSFAVVKKAVHLPSGRDLAVKIVDHNLATKEFLEKFLSREMNIIGGLKHPNIIDVEKVDRPFAPGYDCSTRTETCDGLSQTACTGRPQKLGQRL